MLRTFPDQVLQTTGRILALTAVLMASSAAAGHAGSCPRGVLAQLNGLYRWHVASQSRDTFSTQKKRFTPSLYNRINKAFALSPEKDGRFVDFDIFSDTQVATFGADVLACYPATGTKLEAIVAVRTGLRGMESEFPQLLRYRMIKDSKGQWRIRNILWGNYGEQQNLKRFLNDLLS